MCFWKYKAMQCGYGKLRPSLSTFLFGICLKHASFALQTRNLYILSNCQKFGCVRSGVALHCCCCIKFVTLVVGHEGKLSNLCGFCHSNSGSWYRKLSGLWGFGLGKPILLWQLLKKLGSCWYFRHDLVFCLQLGNDMAFCIKPRTNSL